MQIKSCLLPAQTYDEYSWFKCPVVIHLLFYVAATYDWLLEVILIWVCVGQLTGVVGIIEVHVLLIFVLDLSVGAHVAELLVSRWFIDCPRVHRSCWFYIHVLARHSLLHFAFRSKLAIDEIGVILRASCWARLYTSHYSQIYPEYF